MSTYTAQRDAHGNVIVCRGEVKRNGYTIIKRGSYNECMACKVVVS